MPGRVGETGLHAGAPRDLVQDAVGVDQLADATVGIVEFGARGGHDPADDRVQVGVAGNDGHVASSGKLPVGGKSVGIDEARRTRTHVAGTAVHLAGEGLVTAGIVAGKG